MKDTVDWKRVAHIMCGALMPFIGPEKAQKILKEAMEERPNDKQAAKENEEPNP